MAIFKLMSMWVRSEILLSLSIHDSQSRLFKLIKFYLFAYRKRNYLPRALLTQG